LRQPLSNAGGFRHQLQGIRFAVVGTAAPWSLRVASDHWVFYVTPTLRVLCQSERMWTKSQLVTNWLKDHSRPFRPPTKQWRALMPVPKSAAHRASQRRIRVSFGTPTSAEMSRQDSPFLRSFRARSVSTSTVGRPKRTPRRVLSEPILLRNFACARTCSPDRSRIGKLRLLVRSFR
jgi:hypothetical protein